MISFEENGLTLELRTETVDLTRDRLGDQCLDYAVSGMTSAAAAERSPDGSPWAPLATRTIREKGDARIGYRTGAMIGALNAGTRAIEPHRATWSYPQGATYDRAKGFHEGGNGRVARPLVGWSGNAKSQTRSLLRDDTLEQDPISNDPSTTP